MTRLDEGSSDDDLWRTFSFFHLRLGVNLPPRSPTSLLGADGVLGGCRGRREEVKEVGVDLRVGEVGLE